MIKAIVTDIEGTTSSIRFVKEVLFPYAAKSLPDYLVRHWQEPAIVREVDAILAEEPGTDRTPDAVNDVLQGWIAEDRKATPLKSLQGMIWKAGYESGDYQAHLYADTAPCLQAWRDQGIRLFVYSSGSIAAQKLFFGFSQAGDLRSLFDGYFDTTTGAKQDAKSYQSILETVAQPPSEVLFLSDIREELDAAAVAGMKTVQLDREGVAVTGDHLVVSSFREIDLDSLK